jgi:hypothetical protein
MEHYSRIYRMGSCEVKTSKSALLKKFNGQRVVAQCVDVWTFEAWSESALVARIVRSGHTATIQSFDDARATVVVDGMPIRFSRSTIRERREGIWTTRSADSFLLIVDSQASFVDHKALTYHYEDMTDGQPVECLRLTLGEGYICYQLAN